MVAVNYVPFWNRLLDIGLVAWLSLFIIEEKLSLFDLSNQNLVLMCQPAGNVILII